MTEFEKWVDEVWDSLDGFDTIDKMQDAYNAGRKNALQWVLSECAKEECEKQPIEYQIEQKLKGL